MHQVSIAALSLPVLLLLAPLSASLAQPVANDLAPIDNGTATTLPGHHSKGSHPRCRHHADASTGPNDSHGGNQAGHKSKACQHGKRRPILQQLERIEQRQILIETMLRQLLERQG